MLAILFENLLDVTNTVNRIRVACIGDSITQITNYPSELQTMLGASYVVENFGVSGSTVLNDTYRPYIHRDEFQRAKAFLPNTVVIMLGTNDANTYNFPIIDNFVDDYTRLISEVQALASKPRIFIVKPPPIFYTGLDLNNTNLLEGVMPHIEQVAKELDLPTIDVYDALINHPEYFPDGVHPNNEGGTAIANQIYQSITFAD